MNVIKYSTLYLLLLTGVSNGLRAEEHSSSPDSETSHTVRDYTPEGFVRQPSFVENAGLINKNEHAFLFFADAELLPAAVMLGYKYGLYYWWDIGIDVGGNMGVFQALFDMRMENLKTRRTELFYWGFRFKTGYKYHEVDWSEDFFIEDRSWVYDFENILSLRIGKDRKKAIYLTTKFYMDQDLHTPRRQIDYYLGPAHLGFETVVGKYTNFFVEAGVFWSINGMETSKGIMYENDWFPVMKLGFAARTGDRTAIYYARETSDQSRSR